MTQNSINFNTQTVSFAFGDQTISLETGRIARQASGAVLATMGGTAILATTVVSKRESRFDFFPLTVNYQEKIYSAGKIPGGFFKREGRPSEKETLTSRLIDRPIRPLFPSGYMQEVQVVCTVMSADKNTNPDILAMIAASASLCISGAPFQGPIGAARVGVGGDGSYILNPSYDDMGKSSLDMVVAGSQDAILMVESEASELGEEHMLEAVMFAHEQMQTAIAAIQELVVKVGNPSSKWEAPATDAALVDGVTAKFAEKIAAAYTTSDKQQRSEQLDTIRQQIHSEFDTEDSSNAGEIDLIIKSIEKSSVRQRLIRGEPRIDGRDLKTVRPIAIEIGVLPNTHGSALFTRGETQAIVVSTLGPVKSAQIIDALEGEYRDGFMLHYNFPPFCVGETGMMVGPKRREIGHGRLARRGIAAVLPPQEQFPYTIRVVSEITESNGSSSMASICGTSLSLMDAGVPIKAAVAGVAMGLVKEAEGHAIITDILGDEDHLGDMDFKVAGTEKGVTALQMDIKISGITREIMEEALTQAREGRLHILGEMNKVITKSRDQLAASAPTLLTLKIKQDKIRDVIGKGGAVIRQMIEDSGATIDIADDGMVQVYGEGRDSAEAAIQMVKDIVAEAEVGQQITGTVRSIVDFGAFVNILPNTDGLLHISEVSKRRIQNVNEFLKEGQKIEVIVKEVDPRGRIKLSLVNIFD